MAKAVLNGIDAYLPLQELERIFPLPGKPTLFEHPSAHPPIAALIGLPFAFFSYTTAVSLWFFFEIFLIAVSCFLLIRWWGCRSIILCSTILILSVFIWDPVYTELFVGQLNSLLLLTSILGWLRLRCYSHATGGFFLGLAISIKLFLWPVLFVLIIYKRWLSLFASVITIIATNIMAILLVGAEPFFRYYTKTKTIVFPFWRAHEANFSIHTLGWRFFEGTHGRGYLLTKIPPIYQSETLAITVSAITPLIFFLLAVLISRKISDFDINFSFMLCSSILLSPVAWSHYLTLTMIPIFIIVKKLVVYKSIKSTDYRIVVLSLLTTVLLIFPGINLKELMYFFAKDEFIVNSNFIIIQIPFFAGLLTLSPLVAIICLMGLLRLFDSTNDIKTTLGHNRYDKIHI